MAYQFTDLQSAGTPSQTPSSNESIMAEVIQDLTQSFNRALNLLEDERNFCCPKRCFKRPTIQWDGLACARGCFSYCRCACVSHKPPKPRQARKTPIATPPVYEVAYQDNGVPPKFSKGQRQRKNRAARKARLQQGPSDYVDEYAEQMEVAATNVVVKGAKHLARGAKRLLYKLNKSRRQKHIRDAWLAKHRKNVHPVRRTHLQQKLPTIVEEFEEQMATALAGAVAETGGASMMQNVVSNLAPAVKEASSNFIVEGAKSLLGGIKRMFYNISQRVQANSKWRREKRQLKWLTRHPDAAKLLGKVREPVQRDETQILPASNAKDLKKKADQTGNVQQPSKAGDAISDPIDKKAFKRESQISRFKTHRLYTPDGEVDVIDLQCIDRNQLWSPENLQFHPSINIAKFANEWGPRKQIIPPSPDSNPYLYRNSESADTNWTTLFKKIGTLPRDRIIRLECRPPMLCKVQFVITVENGQFQFFWDPVKKPVLYFLWHPDTVVGSGVTMLAIKQKTALVTYEGGPSQIPVHFCMCYLFPRLYNINNPARLTQRVDHYRSLVKQGIITDCFSEDPYTYRSELDETFEEQMGDDSSAVHADHDDDLHLIEWGGPHSGFRADLQDMGPLTDRDSRWVHIANTSAKTPLVPSFSFTGVKDKHDILNRCHRGSFVIEWRLSATPSKLSTAIFEIRQRGFMWSGAPILEWDPAQGPIVFETFHMPSNLKEVAAWLPSTNSKYFDLRLMAGMIIDDYDISIDYNISQCRFHIPRIPYDDATTTEVFEEQMGDNDVEDNQKDDAPEKFEKADPAHADIGGLDLHPTIPKNNLGIKVTDDADRWFEAYHFRVPLSTTRAISLRLDAMTFGKRVWDDIRHYNRANFDWHSRVFVTCPSTAHFQALLVESSDEVYHADAVPKTISDARAYLPTQVVIPNAGHVDMIVPGRCVFGTELLGRAYVDLPSSGGIHDQRLPRAYLILLLDSGRTSTFAETDYANITFYFRPDNLRVSGLSNYWPLSSRVYKLQEPVIHTTSSGTSYSYSYNGKEYSAQYTLKNATLKAASRKGPVVCTGKYHFECTERPEPVLGENGFE